MRSIQTSFAFPLSSVKPLEGLIGYREYCVGATRIALLGTIQQRQRCTACTSEVVSHGEIEGLEYVRCPACESIFLCQIASPSEWERLLRKVAEYRHSPSAFHSGIIQSRYENVYAPKLEWIESTLRLQDVARPRVMEVVTPPCEFTALLERSGSFAEVFSVNEMELVRDGTRDNRQEGRTGVEGAGFGRVQAAILLESLDRVDDPVALLRGTWKHLSDGGLLFVTALVRSGFDMTVLGLRNLYLYPPDRANCFTLRGLELLLSRVGFTLLEVSTPGVLDVEIVQGHLRHDPSLPLSAFERQLMVVDSETRATFQSFLQQHGLSSFGRIVARKQV